MMTFMHLLLKAANHLALLMPGVSSSDKQQQYADDVCQRVFAKYEHLAELGCTAAFRTLSDPKYCGKMKVRESGNLRPALLNLWAAAADICLVGRDQGWEFRNCLCESLSRLQMEIYVLAPEKCKEFGKILEFRGGK